MRAVAWMRAGGVVGEGLAGAVEVGEAARAGAATRSKRVKRSSARAASQARWAGRVDQLPRAASGVAVALAHLRGSPSLVCRASLAAAARLAQGAARWQRGRR